MLRGQAFQEGRCVEMADLRGQMSCEAETGG